MRSRLTLCIGLLLLLASPAFAQQTIDTLTNPIQEPFEKIVLVKGRVVTADDQPMSKVRVKVGLAGLEDVRVAPTTLVTTCNGDFRVWFEVGTLPPGAKAFVRLIEEQGKDMEGNTVTLEPGDAWAPLDWHFRTADLTLETDQPWDYVCEEAGGYWGKRLTVWGRFVNGTDYYMSNGTRLSATPIQGESVNLTIEVDGREYRPRLPVPTDERGDFIYSEIFRDNVTQATVRIYREGEVAFNETWTHDPTRVVVANVNFGKERPEPVQEAPALGALGAVAAGLVATALVVMRRRG